MFIRAGRMGNMASDVRSAGQEQGKKVLNVLAFVPVNQSTHNIYFFDTQRSQVANQHTSSITHLMIMLSAVNSSFKPFVNIPASPPGVRY